MVSANGPSVAEILPLRTRTVLRRRGRLRAPRRPGDARSPGCSSVKAKYSSLRESHCSFESPARLLLLVVDQAEVLHGQASNSMIGRTSMLPMRDEGIFAATWIASFRSFASIR